MQIELKPLRCFVAVADELHFHRAAARLNLTQPALSAQIRMLERLLGFSLFERTTRRVELTANAAKLLPHVRNLMEASRRVHAVAGALRSDLPTPMHLGAAFYTIDIPERVTLIEGFFGAHPDVRLDVSAAYQNALVRSLRAGTIDVALLLGLPVSSATYDDELRRNPSVETIFPDDLPRLVLRRERVQFLWPCELADHDEVPLACLAGRTVVMLGRDHGDTLLGPVHATLEAAGAKIVIPPESHAIGVERYARQFRMPAISLGWFGGTPDSALVRRPLEGLHTGTEFSLVRAPTSISPALALFWKYSQGAGSTGAKR